MVTTHLKDPASQRDSTESDDAALPQSLDEQRLTEKPMCFACRHLDEIVARGMARRRRSMTVRPDPLSPPKP